MKKYAIYATALLLIFILFTGLHAALPEPWMDAVLTIIASAGLTRARAKIDEMVK